MKRLKYDKDKFFVIDVETTRKYKDLPKEDLKDYLYLRRKELDSSTKYKEANEDFHKVAQRFDRYSKIVCISMGFFHKDKFKVQTLKGEQKDILSNLFSIANKVGKSKMLCGHNISAFDIPTIRKKALEEGFDLNNIPDTLNDVFKKPWDISDNAMDTMIMFKGAGFINTSMEDLAHILGVKYNDSGFRGIDVSDKYWESEDNHKLIYDYCEDDVITTAKILCKMLGLEFIEEVEVIKSIDDVSPSDKLFKHGILDETNVKYFQEKLSKLKTKKSKKVHLKVILAGLYGKENLTYKKLVEEHGK